MQQVLLNGLFTTYHEECRVVPADLQSLLGQRERCRPSGPRIACRWNKVLDFLTTLALHNDSAFATLLLFGQLDNAVDFRNDCRFLRLTSFEDFRNTRQTPVMSLTPVASRGISASSVPAEMVLPLESSRPPLRQEVNVQRLTIFVFNHDLGMEATTMVDDHSAEVTAWVAFHTHGFAFDHVVVSNLATDFCKNRNLVRVPFAKDVALSISCPSLTFKRAPVGTSYFSSSRPFGSRIAISPFRLRTMS